MASTTPGSSPYKLVDIGANLGHKSYPGKDLEDIVGRAKEAGYNFCLEKCIIKIMVTGTSVKESKESLRLSRLFPGYLYSTAGVHPHDAKNFTSESIGELEALASQPECVAIGECGLDFNRNFSTPEEQLKAFEAQVKLACKLSKPLFIHEREASEDMKRILNQHKDSLPPTVIHCFTGSYQEAQEYINMGLYIGLTGFLWKDRSDNGVQYALRNGLIPMERLLLETDAPFMFPNVTHKKLPEDIRNGITDHSRTLLKKYCSFNRNEPCALAAICELIGGFAGLKPDEVAINTTLNAFKVFPALQHGDDFFQK